MKANRLVVGIALAFFLLLSAAKANEPPLVTDKVICCPYAGINVTHVFTTSQGDEPITWGDFMYVGYTPNYGGMGPPIPGILRPSIRYSQSLLGTR